MSLRVVRGAPDARETAALTAVLAVALAGAARERGHADDGAGAEGSEPRPAWRVFTGPFPGSFPGAFPGTFPGHGDGGWRRP